MIEDIRIDGRSEDNPQIRERTKLDIPIDPSAKLSAKIYQHVIENISNGKYPPGSKIDPRAIAAHCLPRRPLQCQWTNVSPGLAPREYFPFI